MSRIVRPVSVCINGELSTADAVDGEVLDLEKLLDSVFRSLATDSRFLEPAERSSLVGERAGIHCDDPELERLANPPRPAEIRREEVGSETVRRVIGELDDLRLRLEL